MATLPNFAWSKIEKNGNSSSDTSVSISGLNIIKGAIWNISEIDTFEFGHLFHNLIYMHLKINVKLR